VWQGAPRRGTLTDSKATSPARGLRCSVRAGPAAVATRVGHRCGCRRVARREQHRHGTARAECRIRDTRCIVRGMASRPRWSRRRVARRPAHETRRNVRARFMVTPVGRGVCQDTLTPKYRGESPESRFVLSGAFPVSQWWKAVAASSRSQCGGCAGIEPASVQSEFGSSLPSISASNALGRRGRHTNGSTLR